MALDEEGKRLFVGARSPALMLVYDTGSGELKAKVPICGDTDDLFFDAERKRVYVICGEGKVEVFSASLSREFALVTSRGARTGLFVREYGKLYVAAPAMGGTAARILVFEAKDSSHAQSEHFDSTPQGAIPPSWEAGVTGSGSPRWAVRPDATAPSGTQVLEQSGSGTFPWCVKKDVALRDGFVEVKFKPLRGREDQAGGVVWRWQDRDHYYVARANALENNVSLYYTAKGRRNTIKYVDAPVAANTWHTLRVEFRGDEIAVALDGTIYIRSVDDHLTDGGAVGVWTKADSVTAFDDFSYGSL
jgi:hypothetical protein